MRQRPVVIGAGVGLVDIGIHVLDVDYPMVHDVQELLLQIQSTVTSAPGAATAKPVREDTSLIIPC